METVPWWQKLGRRANKAWIAGAIIGVAAIPQTRELIQQAFDAVPWIGGNEALAGFIMALLGYAVVWAKGNRA